ncbi:MAG TPA: NAD(P)H-binding protein [Streptosporangiaceae bacterium]|nr:NAD(P)H-binding protein [Streptosporangiaceae bacterium]
MARILVTGGTGVLGRGVVRRLAGRADVRVLSRRAARLPDAEVVRGDLNTGDGLGPALRDVEVVVHCAGYSRDPLRPGRDTEQTRRLIESARAAGGTPHLVYISIVGADRIPLGYYRAKLAGERLVAASGLPWTLLRATQFHELVLTLLMLGARGPVAIVPRGFRFQPVEAQEVADRMAELALRPSAGRVPDLGGPRVERVEDLMRAYLSAAGRRRRILALPLPGGIARGYRDGGNLLTDGVTGSRTFAEFLRASVRPDGPVAAPYGRKTRR